MCARKGKGRGNVKANLPSLRVKPFTDEIGSSDIVYKFISIRQPSCLKPVKRFLRVAKCED